MPGENENQNETDPTITAHPDAVKANDAILEKLKSAALEEIAQLTGNELPGPKLQAGGQIELIPWVAPCRRLVGHHDGFGLNDSIDLVSDEIGPGGAAHAYEARIRVDGREGRVSIHTVALAVFQKGPRNEPGSTPGITEAVLLEILIDRLEGFQAGQYACRQNADALEALIMARDYLRLRARERASRGVLGKYER
jgi:hypothetical protein